MRRIWALLVCGCTLPGVDVEGRHIVVSADPGLEMCGGSLEHMDAFIERVAEELGVEVPGGNDKVEFFWLTEDFNERSGCSGGVVGCFGRGKAYGTAAPFNHEVVHAVAAPLGRMPTYFVEGLAVAFEGIGMRREWEPVFRSGTQPVLHSITATEAAEVDYAEAGAFTVYLFGRFGVAEVLWVVRGLPRKASRGDVDAAFRAGFGVTLAEVGADFDNFWKGCPWPQTALLLECAAPEVAWDGLEFAEFRGISCAQEDVIGPYDGTTMAVLRTLEVREAGLYEVNVIADGFAGVMLIECGGCGPRAVVRVDETPVALALDAGLYAVRLVANPATVTEIGWAIRRL